MSLNSKKKIALFSLLTLGFGITQFYQNCAPFNLDNIDMSSKSNILTDGHTMGNGSGEHPPTEEVLKSLPQKKQMVVNKVYIASIFREIFTSTKFPISTLENTLDKWVNFKGAQWGGSCNYYSSYSSKDCGGSASNVNLPHFADDNTVRESFRIQLCDNILGLDAGVNAALEKVDLTNASAINAANISLAYSLFYRNDPASEPAQQTLLDLNKTLEEAKYSNTNRWRAILSQICESPSWQIF
jgi:hypothetical protein